MQKVIVQLGMHAVMPHLQACECRDCAAYIRASTRSQDAYVFRSRLHTTLTNTSACRRQLYKTGVNRWCGKEFQKHHCERSTEPKPKPGHLTLNPES